MTDANQTQFVSESMAKAYADAVKMIAQERNLPAHVKEARKHRLLRWLSN